MINDLNHFVNSSPGLRIVNAILAQQKREHVKILVDPFEISKTEKKSNHELAFGVRKDNEWLQYDIERAPRSQSEWDEPRYM